MRKILAGFLATSMVCSMATMVSAATNATVEFTATAVTAKADDDAVASGSTTKDWTATIVINDAKMTLFDAANKTLGTIPVSVNESYTGTADAKTNSSTALVYTAISMPAATVAQKLNGKTFSNINIGGVYYSGHLVASGATVSIKFDQNASIVGLADASLELNVSTKDISTTYTDATAPTPADPAPTIAGNTVATATTTPGTATETIDKTTDGAFKNAKASDIFVCYSDGTPIPLTEKAAGVDNELNTQGGVQSGKTFYFMIRDDDKAIADRMEDDNYWKMKVTKGKNAKQIKEISDVTKIFNSDLFDANKSGTATVPGTGDGKRHRYVKVKLNENYTDDELKLTFDIKLSAQSKAVDAGIVKEDSTEIKINDISVWMKNIVKSADNDWKVGVNGLMLELLENDWNNITWYDEDGDLAHLKLFADSDTDKFFSKLSTKWDNADYASYFNDQDAFKFEFTGSPNLSATSRADLEIYNPFVDEDGNETIDPATAVIYSVVDGELFDVSDSFTYTEGDNGDMAYKTRTRFLGTYIICEKAVEEASTDAAPDELAPDEIAPDEIAPDAGKDNGGKAPANTGKYL